MSENPRLYRIVADDGTEYFGTIEHISSLPQEYKRQIIAQIEVAAQGNQPSPVIVPRHELVRAKFFRKEDLEEEMPPPETPQNIANTYPIAMRDEIEREKPKYDMCENCPFKETAMKVINKTLEKI